jgi:hypothetical protein
LARARWRLFTPRSACCAAAAQRATTRPVRCAPPDPAPNPGSPLDRCRSTRYSGFFAGALCGAPGAAR